MPRSERPEAGRPNKVAGAILVAQHAGRPLPYPIPPLDVAWHSPNTEQQRCALWLHAYPPGHPLHAAVVKRIIANFDYQERFGHQRLRNANEFNTDGHFSHHCRGVSAIHTTAREQCNEQIVEQCLRWWSNQLWLMQQLACPSDRWAARVVGLGARFEGGWREERDIAFALLRGVPHLTLKGKRFWENAKERQDIFGLYLLRLLVEDGAFKDLRPLKPTSAGPYEIRRYEGGHVTRGSYLSGPPPPPDICWVSYNGGDLVIGTQGPPPDIGREVESVYLEPAAS